MSTIQEIMKRELHLLKTKKQNNTLEKGLNWTQEMLEHVKEQLVYKHTHKVPRGVVQTNGFQFASTAQLEEENKQYTKMAKVLQEVFNQFGDSNKWHPHDFNYGSFVSNPGYVLKQHGAYNGRGYPTFDMFYVKQGNQYEKCPVKGDSYGFYFELNGEKMYYYRYNDTDSEDEVVEVPLTKPPGKHKSKKKHTEKPQSEHRTQSGPVPGSSKHLLGREGHGLSRLLAEAKDPPVLEFRGTTNVLKGFRRRVKEHYSHMIQGSTSTYHWGLSHHVAECYMMISFDTPQMRSEFLKKCHLSIPEHRTGNLAGWSKRIK
ncbi:E2 protein [Papillomaviridae sp. Seabass_c17043]|nr:E2 protein [Papillomaviridae sp. Seabass_c17043]